MEPGEPLRNRSAIVPWVLVACLTIALTILTTIQAFDRYQAFRSGWSWDLAYYNQWFWVLIHGDRTLTVRPVSAYATEGPSIWRTNYLSPVRWLIVPIYWLAPDPRTLLVIQNVIFWWVIPASYTLVRSEARSSRIALAAVALVPLTPLLWPLVWNDFRELQLALPFVLWAMQGVRGRDRRLTVLGVGGMPSPAARNTRSVAATLAFVPPREPEDVGQTYRWSYTLIAVAIGLVLVRVSGHLKLFVSTIAVVDYLQQFSAEPVPARAVLITAAEFLVLGAGAWGILAFVSPRNALPATPWLFQLSNGAWSMRFLATESWQQVRYTAPLVATLLAAGLIGFSRLSIRVRDLRWLVVIWLVALLVSGFALRRLLDQVESQPRPISAEEARGIWACIDQIGPEETVLATYEVTAPLSSRRYLHSYRLYLNRPAGFPKLAPEFTWIFYRTRDRMTKTFIDQGFTIVHSGPEIVVLHRERAAHPGKSK